MVRPHQSSVMCAKKKTPVSFKFRLSFLQTVTHGVRLDLNGVKTQSMKDFTFNSPIPGKNYTLL